MAAQIREIAKVNPAPIFVAAFPARIFDPTKRPRLHRLMTAPF